MPEASGGDKRRIVGLLREEWSSIGELLTGLSDEQWSSPALPGWDVHDVVAHMVGTERMLSGIAHPDVPSEATAVAHVRNEIGRRNEEWVVDLRRRSHAELLADFRAVTASRLEALEAMGDADLDAPAWTPGGDATYGRVMEVRVVDGWMHEQDIRSAVGVPGNEEGPVAEQALDEVVGALGYIVGKRAGAPDGSSVTIRLTGPIERRLHVRVDGRAKVVPDLDGPPAAGIAMSSSLFLRLAGGRVDPDSVLDRVELSGEAALARQLATSLAYTI